VPKGGLACRLAQLNSLICALLVPNMLALVCRCGAKAAGIVQ